MRTVTIVGITVLLTAVLTADATTHRVPQDFATIQLAINAAVNGDTVVVAEGTYTVNLLITKKIVLGSLYVLDNDTTHITKTILDGSAPTHSDSGAVVVLAGGTDSTTVITGFTITKGTGMKLLWGSSLCRYGGGVVMTELGGGRIRKNIISNNSITVLSGWGGGAAAVVAWANTTTPVRPQRAIIEDNIVTLNNVYPSSGTSYTEVGGIGVWNGYCRISGNVIQNNRVQWISTAVTCFGGGIGIASESNGNDSMIVVGNVIEGNRSRRGGGLGISGNGVRAVVYGNIIRNNTGDYGGGGIFLNNKLINARVTNNIITGNNAGERGGGIMVNSTNAIEISNNLIAQNSSSVMGGGIFVLGSKNIKVVNNTIADNTSANEGAGIFVSNSTTAPSTVYGINNIIWNPGVLNNEAHGLPVESFHHNLIRGESMVGSNNFNNNPQFVQDGTYRLSDESPCIAAGVLSKTVLGVPLSAPSTDLFGTVRSRPEMTAPDIGAIESDAGTTVTYRLNRVDMRQFDFGGVIRYYAVLRPKGNEQGTNQGVLLYLQSYGSTPNDEMSYFQLHRVADSLGFLIVYPAAYNKIWNSGINDNSAWPAPSVDDVGFISTLIDTLHFRYGADTNRVYVVGYSNGAFMAYKLAAQLAHRIQSVVAVNGTLTSSTASGYSAQRPIPLFILNGTADPTVPYGGGQPGWFSTASTLEFWRQKNGADSLESTYNFPNINISDGSTVKRFRYVNTEGRRMIWFYYVENGNHDWPGPLSYPSAAGRNQDIDMHNEIYEFITDKITSVKDLNSGLPDRFTLTQNYPNPFNPSTTIRYALPQSAKVKLVIYDLLGREIVTLMDEVQSAGWKEVEWSASNLSSGMYFYKLSAGNYLQTRKMMVVK
jgi:polyhydroxybutyrate depolymerase